MRILTAFALLMTLSAGAASSPDVPYDDACLLAIADGTGATQKPLPAVFGLLSWNVRKGLDAGWEGDLSRLAEGAHLLFLQEASPGPRLNQLLTDFPHRYFAPGFSLAARQTGVLTASAPASALHCQLRSVEPWLGTPKATSVTLYAVGQRRAALLTINLHGINLSIGTQIFRRQLGALDRILASHDGPIIFGGDINAWSATRLSIVDELAARHGLHRVNFQPDLRSRIVGLAMDYIYLRGLDSVLAEAIPVTTSDHNPLLLKLALSDAD